MQQHIALCLVSSGSKIALVKNAWGWSLPGGKIHEGESPAEAAIREVREELGVTITSPALLGEREHPQSHKMAHYFSAELAMCEPLSPVNKAEIEKAVWIEAKDATLYLSGDIYPPLQEALDQIASRRTGIKQDGSSVAKG